ncbi:MAG TPA: alpha/beta hydrolase-fold protein, partial [Polyangia bacterium]
SSDGAAPDGPSAGAGMQGDPGTEGDGTFMQPPPYTLPPEGRMAINNAPKGQLLGPMVHTLKGTYPNWSAWKFTYWVYVPAQYKPGKAAALMVFQDGSLYIGPGFSDARFNTPQVFDNLIHEGAMPVTIGVFIEAGSSNGQHVGGGDPGRSRQYDTPSNEFGKFILTEFLPDNVLGKYTIVSDPDGWATGGHSSGGIAAFMMAWYYPDKFRKVLAASPSFSNTRGVFPAEILKVTPPKPIRVYHMAGTRDLGGWLAANNQAAMNFKQMGYHHRYRPGEDIHYPPTAAAADFPDALRWLWRAYKLAP